MKKSSITEIIDDIRDGKMVIILDDESRENEGDLVCAAEAVTPEIINFMASKGKGLICLPMSKRLCDKFDLQMMTNKNRAANKTAFTVSIVGWDKEIEGKQQAESPEWIPAGSTCSISPAITTEPVSVSYTHLTLPTIYSV